MQWKKMAMTGALALATVAAPIASARDRCDRPSYSRSSGYTTSYRDYGYRDSGYRSSGYRNSGYRDYGYRDYGSRSQGYSNYGGYREQRSTGKSAAIIGGSAAAGAVIGGLAGDGKGAAIGAIAGAIGGVVVDQTTKNRDRYGRRW
jgi:hypothetical protein